MLIHYITDPMCSWCWGFAPTIAKLESDPRIELHLVMGGLAPDSNDPMPEETRRFVQDAWHAVSERTGAEFNFEFWQKCRPRRSTYPACRAVKTAEIQGAGPRMFKAIQRAYYLEARNPSEDDVLVDIASDIDGLDIARFREGLGSAEVAEALAEDLRLARRLGVQGFPGLVVERGGEARTLCAGWMPSDQVMERIRSFRGDTLI